MQAGGTDLSAPQPLALGAAPASAQPAWKEWLPLLLLQAVVAGIVLYPFLDGTLLFAYLDIASDTYVVSAGQMHLSRLFSREGFTGWSFHIGLGAPLALAYGDIIGQLAQLGGPSHVLELRIWTYLLKIALGGTAFFFLVRSFAAHKETALLTALAYSFCGYVVSNGVWDSEMGIFMCAPLVLWGMRRCLHDGDLVTLPLAVAAMLLSGVFFVMAGVSLFFAFAGCVALSASPRDTLRLCLTRLVPLTALGFLLAAPYVLPVALQLADSPRIGGASSLISRLAGEAFGVSSLTLLLQQLGGLFHKDIFGIGSMHGAYMNYLESPGFYVGVLPLVLLPQLWKGDASDRRLLAVGLAAVALYMVFPVFRLSAFAFSAPYFRGTTLWVSLVLLLMGSRALDGMLSRGVDTAMLAVGLGCCWGLLALLAWLAPVSPNHAMKMAVIAGVWSAVLLLARHGRIAAAKLPSVLLGLLVVELVTTAWPSYFVMRSHALPGQHPFVDVTVPALEAIRADRPPAFYRVEKTFDSAGQADSLAQNYFGVKSYFYHGRSVVRFHEGMDLMLDFQPRPVNYTNWLPAPTERFILHSVLGVRYIISKERLEWPGLERLASGDGWYAYRNELALPLGVVHTRQVMAADMAALSARPRQEARWIKDVALVNAVMLDAPMPQWGRPFDLAEVAAKGEINTPRHYAQPALALQKTGLQVTKFSSDHIAGTIRPDEPGILVFSIPAYRGWSLRIDGQPVEMFTANFGMLAAPVAAGAHEVELTYRLPGLQAGFAIGLAALLGLLALRARARRSRS